MVRNRRKIYGETELERDRPKPCPKCGCRHTVATERDAVTGRVTRRACRHCGAPVAP